MDIGLTQKTKSITIGENPKISTNENYRPPEQSANVLFNFMRRLDYLKNILLYKAMIPRYYEETLEYLEIDNLKRIAFPMICFCDIHLNKLMSHMDFYGFYGIGLNKERGIRQGILPIHYINPLSPLKKDFSDAFSYSLAMTDEEMRATSSMYMNYLLTNLLYIKPLNGSMLRDGAYALKNFHDEREWRYIPDVNKASTELPLLVHPEQLNPKAYNTYSNGLKRCSELWLKLEYTNIKYLIVQNEADREDRLYCSCRIKHP